MIQKIIKVGTSVAVVIPAFLMKEQALSAGQEVRVTPDGAHGLRVEFLKKKNVPVDTWVDDFLARYKGALKELADK